MRGLELIEKWNTDMGRIMKYLILMVQMKFSELNAVKPMRETDDLDMCDLISN